MNKAKPSASAVATVNAPMPRTSPLGRAFQQFLKHRLAVFSAVLLVIFGITALGANLLAPYDPNDIDVSDPRTIRGFPEPPSLEHPLGTDDFSRDLLSRALFGMRISLGVGFMAMIIGVTVGTLLGALAGYMGGMVDTLLMRLVDIFLSVPSFVLFLALNAALSPSIWNIIVILGLFSWMDIARIVRAEFLSLKNRDFVVAARAMGAPPTQIVARHLLPNALAPVIVAATLAVPLAILSESALSFLGLGVPPPDASLGSMLQNAQAWLVTAWWMWVIPGTLISLVVLAFNFVGDGLRDAFDPAAYQD